MVWWGNQFTYRKNGERNKLIFYLFSILPDPLLFTVETDFFLFTIQSECLNIEIWSFIFDFFLSASICYVFFLSFSTVLRSTVRKTDDTSCFLYLVPVHLVNDAMCILMVEIGSIANRSSDSRTFIVFEEYRNRKMCKQTKRKADIFSFVVHRLASFFYADKDQIFFVRKKKCYK